MSIFTISRSAGTTTDQYHFAMCFARSCEKGREGPNDLLSNPNHPRTLKTSPKYRLIKQG